MTTHDNQENVKCGSCKGNVKRVYSFGGSKIERTKSEIEDKIKEDAKKIVKRIKNGDQNAISEIYGGEK
jgi:hypothetical protein